MEDTDMGRHRWARRCVLASGVVAAAIAAFAVVGRLAPVVEHGALNPAIPRYELDRVEVLGVRWVVDRHGSASDLATAACLLVGGVVVLAAAVALRRRPGGRDAAATFAALGAGAVFLAVDEALAVHETLGQNLRFLARLPGIDHADDAILPLYGILALPIVPGVLRLARGAPVARLLLGLAVLAGVLALLFDLGPVHGPEESAETAAAALGALACGALVVVHVRRPVLPADLPRAGPAGVDATTVAAAAISRRR